MEEEAHEVGLAEEEADLNESQPVTFTTLPEGADPTNKNIFEISSRPRKDPALKPLFTTHCKNDRTYFSDYDFDPASPKNFALAGMTSAQPF